MKWGSSKETKIELPISLDFLKRRVARRRQPRAVQRHGYQSIEIGKFRWGDSGPGQPPKGDGKKQP